MLKSARYIASQHPEVINDKASFVSLRQSIESQWRAVAPEPYISFSPHPHSSVQGTPLDEYYTTGVSDEVRYAGRSVNDDDDST